MNIWLVTVGEPLLTDPYGDKLHRTGMVAQILASRGHQVTWWTSTFDHVRKKHRFPTDSELLFGDRVSLKLLHSTGYSKNISIMRFVDHWGLGRKFKKQNKSAPKPDVILASMPTLELCQEATRYGQKHQVPVVVDLRDMWPDIFLEAFPRASQKWIKPFFYPMFSSLKRSCQNATAIIGITPEFVDWGLGCAKRKKSPQDRQFWLAYSSVRPAEADIERAKLKWQEWGIEKKPGQLICSFFGTMSKKLDMVPVLEAAKKLGDRFLFVLCGNGDEIENYKRQVGKASHILFPGWVGAAEIWALMDVSDVGLAPYQSRFDFKMSVPTKAIEYFAAGLPVISSLQGALAHVLEEKQCGKTYPNGNTEALTDVLLALSREPQQLKAMGERGLKLYQEEFVGEKVYGELADYLEEQGLHASGVRGELGE